MVMAPAVGLALKGPWQGPDLTRSAWGPSARPRRDRRRPRLTLKRLV